MNRIKYHVVVTTHIVAGRLYCDKLFCSDRKYAFVDEFSAREAAEEALVDDTTVNVEVMTLDKFMNSDKYDVKGLLWSALTGLGTKTTFRKQP